MSAKFLVVGEHTVFRQMLCLWLQAQFPACHILEAANKEVAVVLAQINSLQLVIIDAGFPEIPSLTMIAHIKAVAPTTPLVILSTYDSENFRADAIAAGASTCLTKDAIRTHLQPLVTNLLSLQGGTVPP